VHSSSPASGEFDPLLNSVDQSVDRCHIGVGPSPAEQERVLVNDEFAVPNGLEDALLNQHVAVLGVGRVGLAGCDHGLGGQGVGDLPPPEVVVD